MAGAWHSVARLVFAPHLGLLCIGRFCMGLPFRFIVTPAPLDIADDGLPAFVNVDVFNGHLLLALAPVTIEGLHLSCEGA